MINDYLFLGLVGFVVNVRKFFGSVFFGDRDKGEIGICVYGVYFGDLFIFFLWVFLINVFFDVRLRNVG